MPSRSGQWKLVLPNAARRVHLRKDLDDAAHREIEQAEHGIFRIEHVLILLEHAPFALFGVGAVHGVSSYLGFVTAFVVTLFFAGVVLSHFGVSSLVALLAKVLP